MIKKTIFISLFFLGAPLHAAHYLNLHKAPVSRVSGFFSAGQRGFSQSQPGGDLKLVSQTKQDHLTISRYQQFYRNIKIIGAQVTLTSNLSAKGLAPGQNKTEVNGHLFEELNLDTNPTLKPQEALAQAKASYVNAKSNVKIDDEFVELQLRPNNQNELRLVYLIALKGFIAAKPVWPFFIMDANTGDVIKQWNNIKSYTDSGPGGNEKVQEYWYGKENLPGLEVTRQGNQCFMENQSVRLVNAQSAWDWQKFNLSPVSYVCDNNSEDYMNGAFSVGNDAYYFGHIIVSLFKDWYGVPVLQDAKGNPQQLIMRVHFGQNFMNAFWDGEIMSFGDGDNLYFYPLVSLDVAGHEVAHGFTQQHADLEYHDESGALNESFSDMAGQTARAYLLETTPQLYNKTHLVPNQLTWGLGETLIRPNIPMAALRFMDRPSSDGDSADCVDKQLAQNNRSSCTISYSELLNKANSEIPEEEDRQNYIVHTASGIFNKVFYLLSQQLGIKKTFHVMLIANSKYWTPNTDFKEGACGIMDAAQDLKLDPNLFQSVFNKVGLDVSLCFSSR